MSNHTHPLIEIPRPLTVGDQITVGLLVAEAAIIAAYSGAMLMFWLVG